MEKPHKGEKENTKI